MRTFRNRSRRSSQGVCEMSVITEPLVSATGCQILRHAYEFVQRDWQHASRDASMDQGFEKQFRASCAMNGLGWTVSETREMLLGLAGC